MSYSISVTNHKKEKEDIMININTLLKGFASTGVVLGIIVGCGGGGGNGGGDTLTATANLDEKNVNEFNNNAAKAIGCTYNPLNAAIQNSEDTALTSLTKIIPAARLEKTTQEISGTCASNPGKLTMETSDDNTTIDITFDEYCNDELSGEETTVDGSVHATISQTETSLNIEASTPTPLSIEAVNPNAEGEDINATIGLIGGKVTAALDQEQTFGIKTIVASATSITLDDHVSAKKCTITNVKTNIDMVATTATFSGGMNCTDLGGLVLLEGTATEDATENIKGSATMTDADGQKVKLSTTETPGIFDVTFDNAPLGTMDCSNVTLPNVEI